MPYRPSWCGGDARPALPVRSRGRRGTGRAWRSPGNRGGARPGNGPVLGTGDPDEARRMCGRFAQVVEARELSALYGGSVPDIERPDRWNGAPTQAFLVCRLNAAGRRVLSLQRWGLVPSWASDRAIGSWLINARSETVHEKPAFRAALRRRRCLVPANGWFECAARRRGRSRSGSAWRTAARSASRGCGRPGGRGRRRWRASRS